MKKFVLISGLIFTACFASAKDTVNWQIIHWPPLMILENKGNKITGEYALLMELLQKNLTDYDHEYLEMSWARFWSDIQIGKHICNIFAFKNPKREKYTEFSVPISIFLSNSIIMKKSTLKRLKLGNPKSMSLLELMNKKGIKGFLERSRSYSAPLDKLLSEHERGSNIYRQALKSAATVPMLLENRIDYLLEYPAIASYVRKQNMDIPGEVVSVQIEEIKPYTWGYLACPKNEWGKKLIGRVNKIAMREKSTMYYRDIIKTATTNKAEIQMIDDIYEDFVNATK
ncbi:MAG: hypothetical protein HQM14_20530 [SAR324 cluster bacterium]|nr:hypothetical protein [SAR324 cluster bacterium]